MGWLFILGAGGDYVHASRHIVTLLEAVWRGRRAGTEDYINAPIYVIQTDDPGWWTNPVEFYSVLSQYLSEAGIPHTKLGTYDEIWNTLWQNTPENAIVINCHGEGHPIPPQYGQIYDQNAGDFTSDYKEVAKSYYRDLGKKIRDYGWLVIEPIGYTYFNAMQYGHGTWEKGAIGGAGLNSCLSVIGLSTDCFAGDLEEVKHCCALLHLWRWGKWGPVSVSTVRFVRPVGYFVGWQYGKKDRWFDYCAGAIAFGSVSGPLFR